MERKDKKIETCELIWMMNILILSLEKQPIEKIKMNKNPKNEKELEKEKKMNLQI